MMRLDKFLSEASAYSRRDIRALVKEGRVTIDGRRAASPDEKTDETAARVEVTACRCGTGNTSI